MVKLPYVLAFILAVFICSFSIQGQAQNIDPAALANEPPLVASDIEVYKALLEGAKAAGSDVNKLAEVYGTVAKQNGVTETHAFYVLTKISIILRVLEDPQSKDQLASIPQSQEYFKPTDAEIDLVNNRKAELLALGQ